MGQDQQQGPGSLLLLWDRPHPLCTYWARRLASASNTWVYRNQKSCMYRNQKSCTGHPPSSWALESPHAKSLHITSEAVALRCEQKIKRKFLKIQPKGLRLSRSPQIQDTTCPSHPDFGVQFWGWLCFPQVPQQKHPSRVQYLGEKFPTMLPNSPRIVSMQPSTLERCRRL